MDDVELKLPSLSGVRVLVVDDDPDNLSLVETYLRSRGAIIDAAESVLAARRIIATRKPDFIISDVMMPKVDGMSFIRELRSRAAEDGGQIPAAALTGNVSPAVRVSVLNSGFQAYITKPFDPAELAFVVANWTRGKAV